MEVNLKREAIQYCTPVYSDTLSREETLETVVSDTLPDVARILDVDAAVYLRSKTLLQGSIRIEGSIRGTVLYIGEDSERLQRIEAELPVSFSAEADGTEDTDILAANLCVSSADAKLLNPRKIQFRAGISAAVAAYRSVTAEIPTEAEPTPGLYTLTDTKTVSFLSGIEEKSFLVSDEAELPAGCPPMEKLLFAYGDRGGAQAGRRKDDIAGNGSARYAVSDGRRRCAAAAELSHPILSDP